MRILFTGSRKLKVPASLVRSYFLELAREHGKFEVIVGDAGGTDAAIRSLAYEFEHPCRVFFADWDTHGRSAGPIRNQEMVDTHPNLCVAFPGGAGTANCTRLAKMAGIKIIDPIQKDRQGPLEGPEGEIA